MFTITEHLPQTELIYVISKKMHSAGKTAAVQVEKKQNSNYQGGSTGERERSWQLWGHCTLL